MKQTRDREQELGLDHLRQVSFTLMMDCCYGNPAQYEGNHSFNGPRWKDFKWRSGEVENQNEKRKKKTQTASYLIVYIIDGLDPSILWETGREEGQDVTSLPLTMTRFSEH